MSVELRLIGPRAEVGQVLARLGAAGIEVSGREYPARGGGIRVYAEIHPAYIVGEYGPETFVTNPHTDPPAAAPTPPVTAHAERVQPEQLDRRPRALPPGGTR